MTTAGWVLMLTVWGVAFLVAGYAYSLVLRRPRTERESDDEGPEA